MFRKLHIYNSLDTLKILTFWNIISEDNIYLLDKNYKEGKKFSKREQDTIDFTWSKLQDDYFTLRTDSKSKMDLEKSLDGLDVVRKLTALDTALKSLKTISLLIGLEDEEEIYKKRKLLYSKLEKVNHRIKFNHFRTINEDFEYLTKFYLSLQNTYNLNHKKKKKNEKEQVRNVYKVVANVESWLDGKNLDMDNMVVSRWLAYEEQVINKQKQQQQNKK